MWEVEATTYARTILAVAIEWISTGLNSQAAGPHPNDADKIRDRILIEYTTSAKACNELYHWYETIEKNKRVLDLITYWIYWHDEITTIKIGDRIGGLGTETLTTNPILRELRDLFKDEDEEKRREYFESRKWDDRIYEEWYKGISTDEPIAVGEVAYDDDDDGRIGEEPDKDEWEEYWEESAPARYYKDDRSLEGRDDSDSDRGYEHADSSEDRESCEGDQQDEIQHDGVQLDDAVLRDIDAQLAKGLQRRGILHHYSIREVLEMDASEVDERIAGIRYDTLVQKLFDKVRDGESSDKAREEAVRYLKRLLKEFLPETFFQEFKRTVIPEWTNNPKTQEAFMRVADEARARLVRASSGNVIALADLIFHRLGSLAADPKRFDSRGQERNDLQEPSDFHKLADSYEKRGAPEDFVISQNLHRFADMRRLVDRQYMGVYATAATVWNEFTDSPAREMLMFGCEPARDEKGSSVQDKGGSEGQRVPLSFEEVVDRENNEEEAGTTTVYYYQPRDLQLEGVVAKACKSAFFEAVLRNEKRLEIGHKMPLVGYVADEFHRFVTADAVHGEQSFLDTCRSFGVFACVACQSVASLQYALSNLERDPDKRAHAIDIIFNNTANKLFFRSTDKGTFDRVDAVCPVGSNGNKAVAFRPPSTLGPGECYAALPDGRFERVQLEQYSGEPDEKDPSEPVKKDESAPGEEAC